MCVYVGGTEVYVRTRVIRMLVTQPVLRMSEEVSGCTYETKHSPYAFLVSEALLSKELTGH